MTKNTLSAAQREEARRRYLAGETSQEIGDRLGFTHAGIRYALKKVGVPMRHGRTLREGVWHGNRSLSATQESEVCERYNSGEGPKSIAEDFGIARISVQKILKRNGHAPRPAKRTPKPTIEAACARYVRGEPALTICQEIGVTRDRLYEWLQERGIERRARRLKWEEKEAVKMIRALPAYRKWRRAILRRDNKRCQECGNSSSLGNPLHVHHLLSLSEILLEHRPLTFEESQQCSVLWDLENGLTLCRSCHYAAHRIR
jgi:predicted transcriptional regulator